MYPFYTETMSSDEEYKFNPQRKYQGLALVVVNFTSGSDEREERKGSKKDVDYLEKTFNRLGFKVDLFQNLSKKEFESHLYKYSQDEVLKDYDSFVFAISTHGVEFERVDISEKDIVVHHHAVQMFDGKTFDTKDILDYFSPTKCRALKGKPKIFFIQACRIPESTSTDAHKDLGIGFDRGEKHNIHEEKADTVPNSDRCDEELDKRDKGEPDGRVGGELDKYDGGQPDRRIFENIDRQEEADDAVSDIEDTGVDDGKVFLAAPNDVRLSECKGSHNESRQSTTKGEDNEYLLPVENEQAEDIPDLAKRIRLQVSKEKFGSRDVVDAIGEELTPVQAPVHITAVPCYNDMLIMFASPQGHYAVRNPKIGSYMLKFLYDSVETVYGEGRIVNNRTNFLYVLNDVADKMSSDAYLKQGYKNVTCVVHKLSKDIIFSKGEQMQDSKFS